MLFAQKQKQEQKKELKNGKLRDNINELVSKMDSIVLPIIKQ